MNKENENARDSVAAIGIGAMIVFIALILVAAVASAVIIQTGEKLQQNAQQTGSDTQQEIGGKVSIISVTVGNLAGNDQIVVTFELAPGSEPIADTTVFWTVICNAGGANAVVVSGNFAAATTLANAAVATLNPGNVYMITLSVGTGTPATSCDVTLNREDTMIISVQGGGTTYETLSYTSTVQGDSVV